MKLGNIRKLSYEDLATYTDNFCESNYLGRFQFGKLYHGKIVGAECSQHMMVKVWEVPTIYDYRPGENERRLMDEVVLHRHELVICHPGMLKLYGYCFEDDNLGVVYDFKPFDSVFNLVPKDSFTWLQRIKVALGFASLLKFLHAPKCSFYKPFVVRNLDCAHIVIDEDYNPKLCDFGHISGGIFPDRTIYTCHHISGSYGYIDLSAFSLDHFKDNQDVFAFGAILLSMISKRLYTEEDRQNFGPTLTQWGWREFVAYNGVGDVVYYDDDDDDDGDGDGDNDEDEDEDDGDGDSDSDSDTGDDDNDADGDDLKRPKFSLVHQSLAADPDFDPADGHKITMLGLDCSKGDTYERPNMEKVLKSLLKLNVVKKHADFLGVDKLLSSYENVV